MSDSRRVLLILHRGALAGTEFHALWLAQGLHGRGWNVALSVSEDGPILGSFRVAGIPVHRIRRRWGTDPAYLIALAALARRHRADVLHAHSGRLPILSGRLVGVPVCVETRHGLGSREEPPSVNHWRAEARRCRMADLTLTVSRIDRERLIAGGLDPERVRHVPNGIPALEMHRAPGVPGMIRLGFLGRLAPQKDPLFLIPLAAELDRRIPGRWSLAVAGGGPLRIPLEEGLRTRNVRFLGEIPGPAKLLAEIDVLLAPSVSEGQSIGVLQAMAASVAVVGRNIPTLAEMLGGSPAAGVLLPVDPATWAAEIVALASDAPRREALCEEARLRIRSEHGVDRMVERIEVAYRETLAAKGRG
jgi:glycosyltransferase involved in cell wall biosynthesis